MIQFINKFKIPTILGLGLILAGISSGVFLVVKDQGFLTKASPDLAAQNITISNIEDSKVTISWQTASQTTSFISFGISSPNQNTVLDDRDITSPKVRSIHYVTLKNLQPDTNYVFKITSGKFVTDVQSFKTAKSALSQNGFGPIIGTVVDNNIPLTDGVVYLSISDATIQSSLIKSSGNFLIPISLMRKSDLSDIFEPEGQVAKLTIIAESGQANVLFKINAEGVQLPPIKLGENLDLSSQADKLDKFDLNADKLINAADHAIVLKNFGNTKDKRADLNGDGIVDQKDLDLISKEVYKSLDQ